MLYYEQRTGHLWRDETLIGLGYAGRGLGLNNPAAQSQRDIGPLPQGRYQLFASTIRRLGPPGCVFGLSPDAKNFMFGRSGFFIHCDNAAADFSASEGCIVIVTLATFHRLVPTDLLTVIDLKTLPTSLP